MLAVAGALGIDEGRYVAESYIGIQAMLCAARGVELEDLVFGEGGAGQPT